MDPEILCSTHLPRVMQYLSLLGQPSPVWLGSKGLNKVSNRPVHLEMEKQLLIKTNFFLQNLSPMYKCLKQ